MREGGSEGPALFLARAPSAIQVFTEWISIGIMDSHEGLASAERQICMCRMEVLMTIKSLTIALTAAGAFAVTAFTPATAGPLPTMTAAVAQAAPDHTIEVYWRGGGWGGGFGWRGYGPGLAFGLAAGALAGAAIAA